MIRKKSTFIQKAVTHDTSYVTAFPFMMTIVYISVGAEESPFSVGFSSVGSASVTEVSGSAGVSSNWEGY